MKKILPILILLIPLGAFIYFVNTRAYEIPKPPTQPVVTQVQKKKEIDEYMLWGVVQEWKYRQDGYRYKENQKLCEYAEIRVGEIQSTWGHDGFKKSSQTWIDKLNFARIGENLIRDFTDEQLALEGWLNSPLHRKNLDENFTDSCIRCENNHCVQLFGKKSSQAITAKQPQKQTDQEQESALIKCLISPNCGGGYKETTREICEATTCCGVGSDWKMLDVEECKKQQANYSSNSEQERKKQNQEECLRTVNNSYEDRVRNCESMFEVGSTNMNTCMNDATTFRSTMSQTCY